MQMKKLTIILLMSLMPFVGVAQQTEIYSRVKIDLKNKSMNDLAATGAAVDHGDFKRNNYFVGELSASELSAIQKAGFTFVVLVPDVTKQYVQTKKKNNAKKKVRSTACFPDRIFATPNDFLLGSMGDFYTYEEVLQHLDSLAAKYPNLVSVRQPIDTFMTFENRPIYWLKISDNPNVNETETEVFHTAVHHAREPMSVMQLIFYMYYLCENYATDPEVKYIVDHSEQYFIPIVNPDGYVFNQTTNPQGGGMWRKNRRNNLDGTFGVDLNRNYGYQWGFNNIGSSNSSASDTYRGVAAFSEPETKAVKYFCEQHQFVSAFNNHSYGNLLIYPWGFNDTNSDDSLAFSTHAKLETDYNRYVYGRDVETVGYSTNGTSDDWMYGEQTSKNKILAMTPEVGDGQLGFWPPTSDLLNQCNNNMHLNLNSMRVALAYATLDPLKADYIKPNHLFAHFVLNNIGIDSNATFTASLVPITNNIIAGSPKVLTNVNRFANVLDSLQFTLASTIAQGDVVKYVIALSNGYVFQYDTLVAHYTTQVDTSFYSNCNSMAQWTGSWNKDTNHAVSQHASLTDSPYANSGNQSSSSLQTANPISLMDKTSAKLSFNAKWLTECTNDFVQVAVSADNGQSYQNLCTRKSLRSVNPDIADEPVFEGNLYTWAYDEVSLDDYLDKNILISFNMETDPGFTKDGFYVDDVMVLAVPKVIIPNSVKEIENQQAIDFYPNPSSDYLHFNLNENTEVAWQIFDIVGTKVMTNVLDKNNAIIDIRQLKAGCYVINLTHALGQKTVLRFTKN
jgi:carboxypeptidase T